MNPAPRIPEASAPLPPPAARRIRVRRHGQLCLLLGLAFALGAWLLASARAAEPWTVLLQLDDLPVANGAPAGWQRWSPRQEIAPLFAVDKTAGRDGRAALRLESPGPAAFGAWRARLEGVAGGQRYRFAAWYQAAGVPNERRSVIARLEWLDRQGRAARMPDYALDVRKEPSGWTRVEYVSASPTNAAALDLQLALGFAPAGAVVRWCGLELKPLAAPPRDRVVRAMTVHHRPRNSAGPAQSVESFCRLAEGAAALKPDLLCLPEGITVVGTSLSYAEVSEPVPGPTTARLGETARKLNSYVVAGLYEREGTLVYNTAVLLDRTGRLAGRYRKTHLPREEWERGITPGDAYPVFDTEFGRVGLMICWDVQFPEPARALAAQGAEILLLPIWGGSDVLARARSIENCVFLVSSSYDMRSFIVDPAGRVLAEATVETPVVCAELFLDRPILQPWLGDMKTRTWKERRPDLRIP